MVKSPPRWSQVFRRLFRMRPTVPRDAIFDATFALLREGYPFIWDRCRRFDSDIFKTRILGKQVICIHGPDAARVFYDETKLQRIGVAPRRVVTSLLGRTGVRTLEDGAHRRRKAAFMSLMTPDSMESLMTCMAEHWQLAIRRWEKQPSIVLFDEA